MTDPGSRNRQKRTVEWIIVKRTTSLTAETGPIPIISGSMPDWAKAIIFANGLIDRFWISASDIKRTAAAESFIPEAFPAVTVPPF